jgi:hypothetical protein
MPDILPTLFEKIVTNVYKNVAWWKYFFVIFGFDEMLILIVGMEFHGILKQVQDDNFVVG